MCPIIQRSLKIHCTELMRKATIKEYAHRKSIHINAIICSNFLLVKLYPPILKKIYILTPNTPKYLIQSDTETGFLSFEITGSDGFSDATPIDLEFKQHKLNKK